MASGMRAIQITFQEAIGQADNLSDCANDLKSVQSQLDSIMETLQSGWSGEAASQFLGKCSILRQKLGKASTDLGQISTSIRSTAQAYYEAEMRALELAQTDSSGTL